MTRQTRQLPDNRDNLFRFVVWKLSGLSGHLSVTVRFLPLDARAILLHNDLLCNGTCIVIGGGGIMYNVPGAQTEKIPSVYVQCSQTNDQTAKTTSIGILGFKDRRKSFLITLLLDYSQSFRSLLYALRQEL